MRWMRLLASINLGLVLSSSLSVMLSMMHWNIFTRCALCFSLSCIGSACAQALSGCAMWVAIGLYRFGVGAVQLLVGHAVHDALDHLHPLRALLFIVLYAQSGGQSAILIIKLKLVLTNPVSVMLWCFISAGCKLCFSCSEQTKSTCYPALCPPYNICVNCNPLPAASCSCRLELP